MRKKLTAILFCVLFLTAFLCISCKKNDHAAEQPPTEETVARLQILNAPETIDLSEKTFILSVNGEYQNAELSWDSSNGNVALVRNGEVTLLGAGLVKITVALEADKNICDSVKIRVTDINARATGIRIVNKPQVPFIAGAEDYELDYELLPEEAELTDSAVWSGGDSAVAEVDENGVLKIVGEGHTTVRVALEKQPEIYDETTIEVIAAERKDGKIERNDGLFEMDENGNFSVQDGNISLYSPEYVCEPWASKTSLKAEAANGRAAVRVTSDGAHNYDILYIAIDGEFKSGCGYELTYNAEWKGESGGTFGYFVYGGSRSDVLPLQSFSEIVKEFTQISESELFRTGAKIAFSPKKDCDRVYIYLREAEGEKSDAISFNFLIGEISVKKDTRISGDGTFEGTEGGISVLAPTEVNPDFGWMAQTVFDTETENGNTRLIVKSYPAAAGQWSGLFVLFEGDFEAGKRYNITFDAEWLGAGAAEGFYYTIGEARSEDYRSNDSIFYGKITLTFTAAANERRVYLKIINNSGNAFDCALDNIKLDAAE